MLVFCNGLIATFPNLVIGVISVKELENVRAFTFEKDITL